MRELICRTCGKKVHKGMDGTWYDENGFTCRPGPGLWGSHHPEERSCCTVCCRRITRKMNSADGWFWYDSEGNLCQPDPWTRTAHTPEKEDAVTYTETEIRIAWERAVVRTETEDDAGSMIATLLEELIKGREPDYPYGTVWKDNNGIFWYRTSNRRWRRFGHAQVYSHDTPKRPLKRMDVVK